MGDRLFIAFYFAMGACLLSDVWKPFSYALIPAFFVFGYWLRGRQKSVRGPD